MIDRVALENNQEIKANALAVIEEECKEYQILSYKAMEITDYTIKQADIIDECMHIIDLKKMVTFEEVDRIQDALDKRQQPALFKNIRAKYMASRDWIREYNSIHEMAVLKQHPKGGHNKKYTVEKAYKLIAKGEELSKYLLIKEKIDKVQHEIEIAEAWDKRYLEYQKNSKNDPSVLTQLLRDAKYMDLGTSISAPTLMAQRLNKDWMDEANSYFQSAFRSEKNIHFLNLIIARVDAVKGNDISKHLAADLRKILASVKAEDQKIDDWWNGKKVVQSLEEVNDYIKAIEDQPCILDHEWKLPLLQNIIKWSLKPAEELALPDGP